MAIRISPDSQPLLAPNIELLKQRGALIHRALQQPKLPPLDDTLRNPIYVSPERYEAEATKEATQAVRKRLREKDYTKISKEELSGIEGFIPYDHPQLGVHTDDSLDFVDNAQYFKMIDRVNGFHKNLEERTLDHRVETEIVGAKDTILAHKKQESGLIPSEFDRGQMIQMLHEQGIDVPETRKLDYHIDKFMETQQDKLALGKISGGRLNKLGYMMKYYREWTPITSVDKIDTHHVDEYHKFISKNVIAGKFKPRYANNLFSDFTMFVKWLFKRDVIEELPRSLQLKNDDYKFDVPLETPETIPLELVRKLLDGASPRLKLYILLTLNTGGGASEVGKIMKSEYDPVACRIIRKRSKTKKSANTPVVSYKLWAETKELLDQEIENCKNYPQLPEYADILLVNSNGYPLWREYVGDDGKVKNSDSITSAFKRLVIKLRKNDPTFPHIKYYDFRGTGSSLINNEPRYRGLDELWLGHSPQTVRGKHYNAEDITVLDDCLLWLRSEILGLTAKTEAENVNIEKD